MTNLEDTLTKTERNLWNAIISEAMAQLKYSAYAHKALEEGHPEVAQVFQEVAGAENIHGMNHLRVSGDVKSSLENLKRVVEEESKEISAMYPRMVREALDEGRTDVADAFIMAMDREQHHIEVFSRALDGLDAKLASGTEGDRESSSTRGALTGQRLRTTEPEVSPTYAAAREEVEGERWRIESIGRIREVVFGAQGWPPEYNGPGNGSGGVGCREYHSADSGAGGGAFRSDLHGFRRIPGFQGGAGCPESRDSKGSQRVG